MKRSLACLLLLALSAQANEGVALRRAKYDDLTRFIASHRGSVVVVDFWATFCAPCKAAFPHVIALHQKYQKLGLVVITVSVDDPEDAETVGEVTKFLKQQKATTTNFLFDEPPEVWQKKLRSETIPLVFVFNRAGQIEKKYTEAPKAAELTGLVEKLLGQRGSR